MNSLYEALEEAEDEVEELKIKVKELEKENLKLKNKVKGFENIVIQII